MDINEILKILPHRYPFLLVDRVVESNFQDFIVGVKSVTINEPFFAGHFPTNPVMPGVIQLEAMAQVAGILLNKRANREGKIAYFSSIDKARFRRVVRPGDQLRIEVTFLKAKLNLAKVQARITVDGSLASEGELMFTYDRD